MMDKEKIRNIIELFIAWNGETEPIDIANLNSAVEFISSSLQEEPASDDVEEAAKHYLYSNILYDDVYIGNPTEKDCIEMFKAGDKWRKEQMMIKAIDTKASFTMSVPSICISLPIGVNVGDKVKVIVIKED